MEIAQLNPATGNWWSFLKRSFEEWSKQTDDRYGELISLLLLASHMILVRCGTETLGLVPHLFVTVLRPGDSEVTFAVW